MGGRTAVPCWQRAGWPHSCARLFQVYVRRLKLQLLRSARTQEFCCLL
jgi:hypothetical protein